MLTIAPIYIALIALLFLWLSLRVIAVRRRDHVSLGDGGSNALQRRIRAQGNCAEYAPIGLLIVLAVELQGHPGWIVHGLGLCLLVGRVLHGIALTRAAPWMRGRVTGMVLTFTTLSLGSLALLIGTLG